MSKSITVEDLSKSYRIGNLRAPYLTFREALAGSISKFGRKIFKNKNIHESKRGVKDFWALQDVGFEVEKGERIGIVGRNGAGKSTLLKILSRITEPTKGRVTITGKVATLLEVGTGFHPELSGRENVILNGAILGMKRADVQKKFDEIVAFAGVEKFIDMPVKHFSSGMYARLAFSVAAHLDPEILIVDEVLAVGDAEFQKKCLRKMEDIGKNGQTLLFVSHNMGMISVLCKKCLLLEQGRLKAFDETSKVLAAYQNLQKVDHTIEIGKHLRTRGDGRISFEKCTIMNSEGEKKNAFLIEENMKIDLQIESKFEGEIAFWVIIFDSSGLPILSSHQRDQGWGRISNGHYQLGYETVDLGLMPGKYSISAGAFDRDMNFLEWMSHFQSFEVLPCFSNGAPFDSRWGLNNQKAHWQLRPL